jgi:NIPSNAP
MPAVNRRILVKSIPAAATLFSRVLWATSEGDNSKTAQDPTAIYELRVYHAAPGKMPALLTRFRDHTIKLFEQHGIESVAYWSPLDEPEKGNTLIYILRHPSREAAEANWKSFRDDPNWQSVRDKSEVNGKLVEKVDSTFMALTDFSPRGFLLPNDRR